MTYVIKTSESIDNLALAVYDERDEILREITEDDLIFPVFFNRRIIKRLYLIGEMIYDKNLTVTINIPSESTNLYTAKIRVGLDKPRYSDFDEFSSTHTVSYSSSNYKFLNALPVDVMIESKDITYADVSVDITITAEV